jgi:hypothetical protein
MWSRDEVSQEEELLLVAEGRLAAAFLHLLGDGADLHLLTEILDRSSQRTVARVFRLVGFSLT